MYEAFDFPPLQLVQLLKFMGFFGYISFFFALCLLLLFKAILKDEFEVSAWLNYENIPLTKAVTSLIRPQNCLRMFAVSRTAVGNVHNKTQECVMPFDIR